MPSITIEPLASIGWLDGPLGKFIFSPGFGPSEMTEGAYAVICVYDLELYVSNQNKLHAKNPDGFHEINKYYLTHVGKLEKLKYDKESETVSPLQDKYGHAQPVKGWPEGHTVADGTGVLLILHVRFASKEHKTKHSAWWYIDEVTHADPPAFTGGAGFHLNCLVRHDKKPKHGQKHGRKAYAHEPIGTACYSKNDVEALKKVHKTANRRIVIRIFTEDGEQKVIKLSTLNNKQAHNMNRGKRATIANPNRFTVVPIHPKKKVGHQHARPKPGGPPQPGKATRLLDAGYSDPTGLFVAQVNNKEHIMPPTKLVEKAAQRWVSPSGLWVHAAGKAIVGWYYPLRDLMKHKELFPDAVQNKMLSPDPVTFIATHYDGKSLESLRTLMDGVDGVDVPKGAIRIWAIVTSGKDLVDPKPLIFNPGDVRAKFPSSAGAKHAGKPLYPHSRLVEGYMMIINSGDDLMVGLCLPPPPSAVAQGDANNRMVWFDRLSKATRPPWDIVVSYLDDHPKCPTLTKHNIYNAVEPLPPGTLTKILKDDFEEMCRLVKLYRENRVLTGNTSGQKVTIYMVSQALRAMAGDYGRFSEQVRRQVRAQARCRTIKVHDVEVSLWSQLQAIVDDILNKAIKNNPKAATSPPQELYDKYVSKVLDTQSGHALISGFDVFGVTAPAHKYVYEFQFISLAHTEQDDEVFLQGSVGGFALKITRCIVENEGEEPKEDRSFYVHGQERSAHRWYKGFFVGGGFGMTVDLGEGLKAGAPASPPAECEIDSFTRIDSTEFDGSHFRMASLVGPGREVDLIAWNKTGRWSSTLFELYVPGHIPEAMLTAVVNTSLLKPEDELKSTNEYHEKFKQIGEKNWSEVFSLGISFSLAAVTATWGYVSSVGKDPLQPPDEHHPADHYAVGRVHENLSYDLRTPVVAFEVGKDHLAAEEVRRLDLLVAMYRPVFEQPGWLRIEGFTSPEYHYLPPAQAAGQNTGLAEARAWAVQDKLYSGIGGPGFGIINKHKNIKVVGYENAFAKQFTKDLNDLTKLLDPTCPAAHTPGGFWRITWESHGAEYAKMRKVDLVANGVLVLRVHSD